MAKVSFTSAAARRTWLKRRAKEQEDKRSKAAKKAAVTRRRNARKGVKKMSDIRIEVDTASTPEEFSRMLREEVARRAKTLMSANAYGAGPRTIERMVAGETNDPNLWRTSTGALVHVTQMSDEHLRNTVSYLARRMSHDLARAPFLHELQGRLENFVAVLSECRRRGMKV